MERINIWRGKKLVSASQVGAESMRFNAYDKVPSLEIPVYFFGGSYDYTCCYDLQKRYFDMLEAPTKGFYTFENSAHSPLWEESERAIQILVQDVLKGKNELSDDL